MKVRSLLLLVFCAFAARCAHAQLHVPTLPQLPRINPPTLLRDTTQTLDNSLQTLRQRLVDTRLAAHPDTLTRDAQGQLIVRERILAQPSDDAARERLLAEPGVQAIETLPLDGLDLQWLILRADPKLLPRLRQLDPAGVYDLEHIYLDGGATEGSASLPQASSNPQSRTALRVGLIDSGVATSHPALRNAAIERFGCEGQAHPAPHGTAVASLLVGQDGDFKGALPGARLFAADVYCDAPDGGAVPALARALAWMARERVPVVNISLVGPPNALLERAVRAAQRAGLLIVAAVGNDGPQAPPLYPASFSNVIGVTGVDSRRRVLLEAGRGPQVLLSAPGSDMRGAAPDGRYVRLRGTSFAAPWVAGLLTIARAQSPSPAAAFEVLRVQAIDLGAPGLDPVYGWGLVGESLPSR